MALAEVKGPWVATQKFLEKTGIEVSSIWPNAFLPEIWKSEDITNGLLLTGHFPNDPISVQLSLIKEDGKFAKGERAIIYASIGFHHPDYPADPIRMTSPITRVLLDNSGMSFIAENKRTDYEEIETLVIDLSRRAFQIKRDFRVQGSST